jgi:hypothetical protein
MNKDRYLKRQMRRFPEVFKEPSGTACLRCGSMTTIGETKVSHLQYRKTLCRLCLSLEYYRVQSDSRTKEKGGEQR